MHDLHLIHKSHSPWNILHTKAKMKMRQKAMVIRINQLTLKYFSLTEEELFKFNAMRQQRNLSSRNGVSNI